MTTKMILKDTASRFGYSIRRLGGEYRLVDDSTNAAFYYPRTLEDISEFLTRQESDGEKPTIFD